MSPPCLASRPEPYVPEAITQCVSHSWPPSARRTVLPMQPFTEHQTVSPSQGVGNAEDAEIAEEEQGRPEQSTGNRHAPDRFSAPSAFPLWSLACQNTPPDQGNTSAPVMTLVPHQAAPNLVNPPVKHHPAHAGRSPTFRTALFARRDTLLKHDRTACWYRVPQSRPPCPSTLSGSSLAAPPSPAGNPP